MLLTKISKCINFSVNLTAIVYHINSCALLPLLRFFFVPDCRRLSLRSFFSDLTGSYFKLAALVVYGIRAHTLLKFGLNLVKKMDSSAREKA